MSETNPEIIARLSREIEQLKKCVNVEFGEAWSDIQKRKLKYITVGGTPYPAVIGNESDFDLNTKCNTLKKYLEDFFAEEIKLRKERIQRLVTEL